MIGSRRGALLLVGAAALGVAVVLAALGSGGPPGDDQARAGGAPIPQDEQNGYSNIAPGDYVGPAVCAECHPDKAAGWRGTLHRSMNRLVGEGPEVLLGDFSGVRLEYAGGAAVFRQEGSGPLVSFERGGAEVRRFRVTRTIGWRYLQEYVGIQVRGPERPDHPIYATEIRLPFGYWRRARRWVHQQYYDSWFGPEYRADGEVADDPYEVDATPWASRCAWCHNTYPFELRAVRADENQIGQGLEQFVRLRESELDPGGQRRIAGQNLLPTGSLVTVGISCESCHLGGREHAIEGGPIRFDPVSPALEPRPGAPVIARGRRDPLVVNTICAQCHSTPTPRYPGGGATRNSSEALDLAAGACMSAIRCTDCHDPHTAGPGAGAPDDPRQLAACTSCHPALADPAVARAHSGHSSEAASCLDCHMPRVVQGVSDMVRTHRISSPTGREDLVAGAPNACNLCHLDRSVAWTLRELDARFGAAVAPLAVDLVIDRYGGDLDAPLGEVWLASADPVVRIAAAAAFARAGDRRALPRLLDTLDDPVAHDRMRMLFAVEELLGRPLARREYDPHAPPERRSQMLRRLRARLAPSVRR